MPRSVGTILLLGTAVMASVVWLGWQMTSAAAGGPPTGRAEIELRILSGLVILGVWILAWRRYRGPEAS